MIGASKNIWGFDPRSVPGCVVWLDPADTSSVTLNGANVSQLRDKSGLGYNMSQSNARNQPTYSTALNGNRMLTFTQASSTRLSNVSFPAFIGPRAASYFLVEYNMTSASGNPGPFGYSAGPNFGIIMQSNAGFTGRLQPFQSGIASFTSATPRLTFLYKVNVGSSNMIGFVNGTSQTVSDTTSGTYSGTFSVGSGPNGFISGNICELIIFNTVLTTAQRQQIEGYLTWKWGVQTSMPTTQPYRSLKPHLQYFQPTDIGGVSVWFDAADMTTVTGSSPVTSWRDKSGYRWNATTLIGTAPTSTTVNGLNAISFPASSTLTVSNVSFSSLIQSRAIFVVYRVPTSVPNYISWFSTQASGINNQGGHNNLVIPTGGGGPYLQSFAVGGAVAGMGADPAVNTIGTTALAVMIHSSVSTASNVVTLNGTSYTLTTNTLASGYGSGTVTYYIGNAYPQPYILCEYIMYQREFTIAERQQVEAYLAWKWGITSSLPATHPYKTIPADLVFPPVVNALINSTVNFEIFIVKYNSSGTPLWARRMGGTNIEFPNSISTDSSGNVIIAGHTNSNPVNVYTSDGTTVSFTLANSGSDDAFIVKYDPNGTPLWARRMGGTSNDNLYSVSTDSSGNIIVVGQYVSNPLNIFAANGSTVLFTLAYTGGSDSFVVKYDSSGTPQWARRMAGVNSEPANSVSIDSSGNIIVVGRYNSNPLNIFAGNGSTVLFTLAYTGNGLTDESFVVKYDSSGTPLWARRLSGALNEVASSVSIDSSGNIIVSGNYTSRPMNVLAANGSTLFTLDNPGTNTTDGFVVKYDSSGTPQWARRIGNGTANDSIQSLSVDSSGNVIVVGEYISSNIGISGASGSEPFSLANTNGNSDAFVVKYDSSGTPLWVRRLGGTGSERASSVSTDSSGDIIVFGEYTSNPLNIFAADGSTVSFTLANSGTSNRDGFLIKYDPNGTLIWARRISLTTTQSDKIVSIDSSGNIIVTGRYAASPWSVY